VLRAFEGGHAVDLAYQSLQPLDIILCVPVRA
jgi:hypothetical protein